MQEYNIPQWMSRTQLLLSDEQIAQLINAHVLIVGLGGVGGICAEMIARAGVGKLTIVDADVVEASNRNRQLPALVSTNNLLKADIIAARIKDINPDVELKVIAEFITADNAHELVEQNKFDYVADCIDTLSPKVALMSACYERNIPIISSMGAGGKMNPLQVQVGDIEDTHNCLLSYYVRKKLHQKGIYKGIQVVWSNELADKTKIKIAPSGPKKSVIGTISYMPAIFGCIAASVVIRGISKQHNL